jgi:hypothetical protein
VTTRQPGRTSKQAPGQAAGKQAPGQAGQQRRAGQPAATRQAAPPLLDPPRSVQLAVRLMYAGAALTGLGVLVDVLYILISHSVRNAHPHASAARVHDTVVALIVSLVFSALIEAGLWLFMARANRGGLKWARIVAAVFFAIYTVYLALTLPRGASVADVVMTTLIWLAGLGATIFLWRPDSTAYFSAPAASPSGRPGSSA